MGIRLHHTPMPRDTDWLMAAVIFGCILIGLSLAVLGWSMLSNPNPRVPDYTTKIDQPCQKSSPHGACIEEPPLRLRTP